MSKILHHVLRSDASSAVILIRILVGWVFVSEGIQKFLYPAELGIGRFAKIGIPSPEIMGPFVGVVETLFGGLVLLGLGTRVAAAILIVNMIVAITSTKIPILVGHGFWGFADPKVRPGLWSMLHEARTDFSMVLGSVYLLLTGAGSGSLDQRIASRLAAQGDSAAP
jgi:putative oxidoreductase